MSYVKVLVVLILTAKAILEKVTKISMIPPQKQPPYPHAHF